jgi:hypothetical protein
MELRLADEQYQVRYDEGGLFSLVGRGLDISRMPWKENITVVETMAMAENCLAE